MINKLTTLVYFLLSLGITYLYSCNNDDVEVVDSLYGKWETYKEFGGVFPGSLRDPVLINTYEFKEDSTCLTDRFQCMPGIEQVGLYWQDSLEGRSILKFSFPCPLQYGNTSTERHEFAFFNEFDNHYLKLSSIPGSGCFEGCYRLFKKID